MLKLCFIEFVKLHENLESNPFDDQEERGRLLSIQKDIFCSQSFETINHLSNEFGGKFQKCVDNE